MAAVATLAVQAAAETHIGVPVALVDTGVTMAVRLAAEEAVHRHHVVPPVEEETTTHHHEEVVEVEVAAEAVVTLPIGSSPTILSRSG